MKFSKGHQAIEQNGNSQCKRVFTLSRYENLTYAEIAAHLEILRRPLMADGACVENFLASNLFEGLLAAHFTFTTFKKIE